MQRARCAVQLHPKRSFPGNHHVHMNFLCFDAPFIAIVPGVAVQSRNPHRNRSSCSPFIDEGKDHAHDPHTNGLLACMQRSCPGGIQAPPRRHHAVPIGRCLQFHS
eukprot:scaffold26_cov397-Pavlova_lutheri.AAC.3